MDAPRFPRRRLLRLAGAAAGLALAAEAGRVLFWTNRHAVVPGRVYRSAQLSASGLADEIAGHGIRTVVNRRGTCPDLGAAPERFLRDPRRPRFRRARCPGGVGR